ncbi:MAG: hypothetical protein FD144_2612 [Rhodospirillaceae bacterium]|nr:MAG: hypothetical protein FD144_2612 [Rhodospirillaceae bacterium]
MADTNIEWADRVWNPIAGCSIVSPGCTNCYAMKMAHRIEGMNAALGRRNHYAGLTMKTKAGAVWTGKVAVAADSIFLAPLGWKKPARVFANSMADMFHEDVPDEVIDRAFAVMALCPHLTFMVLTKRAARMREWFEERWQGTPAQDIRMPDGEILHCPRGGETGRRHQIEQALREIADQRGMIDPDIDEQWDEKGRLKIARFDWPLPNVWLGVSTEDQARADERIPHLLATPAAKRFISAEPLLAAIDLERVGCLEAIREAMPTIIVREERGRPRSGNGSICGAQIDSVGSFGSSITFFQTPDHMGGFTATSPRQWPRLDWVIAGGESGPKARASHPDWFRALRDQCAAAGVPFFFKQWGEWAPLDGTGLVSEQPDAKPRDDIYRIGKRRAGAMLDGKPHREFPA